METKIFKREQLDEAVSLLREGELVAFPTETVYGLGALATGTIQSKRSTRPKAGLATTP